MSRRAVSVALLIAGLLLTIAPPVYLSYGTATIVRPVINETLVLPGYGGVLATFHGEKGDVIRLGVASNATEKTGFLVIRLLSERGKELLLQYKLESGSHKVFAIALPATSDYSLYILNPTNSSAGGVVEAVLTRKIPLYESASASTLMIVSVIGAMLLGFAAGYKPCKEYADNRSSND